MLEGMYAAAAGMYAQQARLDALSSDIANANTAGYKPVRTGFRDLLYSEAGLATGPGVQLGAGAAITDLGRATGQGALRTTDRPLDIAVTGPGYLQVTGADGRVLLTRDGNLQIDALGRLGTAAGQLLSPRVTVPAGTDPADVAIAADGTVSVGDTVAGRIRLVEVAAPAGLRAVGDNAFEATPDSGAPRAARDTTLASGSLEGSGVDLGTTMTAMIEAQRAYQLASRAISTQDKVAEIAAGVKR